MRRSDGREHCNAYVRIEHFAEDSAPVERHLGFALDVPIANASDRARDWRPYYTDVTAAAVAEDCAEDIERFGYRF